MSANQPDDADESTVTCTAWLVVEFCDHDLFNGWHLYLRDTSDHRRNADGSWGWLRRGHWLLPSAQAALASHGIVMRPNGDGSCDDDGYAALARMRPIGVARGGIMVRLAEDGSIAEVSA